MQTAVEIASIVAICAAIGGAIDFWIGSLGQNRVKDWIETLWIRLSYVNIRNFGAQEAIFAISVFDRIFGKEFLSWKRLEVILKITSIIVIYFILLRLYAVINTENYLVTTFVIEDFLSMSISLVLFSISLSITRYTIAKALKIFQTTPKFNLIILLSFSVLQYIIYCFWLPFTNIIQSSLLIFYYPIEINAGVKTFQWDAHVWGIFVYNMTEGLESRVFNFRNLSLSHQICNILDIALERTRYIPEVYLFSQSEISTLLSFISNIGRLFVTLIFIASYFLQPLKSSISYFILRLLESGKPIFTILFSGLGGLAKLVKDILKLITS